MIGEERRGEDYHWLFLMPAIAIASFAATKAHGEMVSKEWSDKEKSECLDIEPSSSSSSGSILHFFFFEWVLLYLSYLKQVK